VILSLLVRIMEKSNPIIKRNMKTHLIPSFIAILHATTGYAFIRTDLNDTISKKRACFPSHLSWELQLGSNFLTNTSVSANRPLADPKTWSGSFFTDLILPLEKKEVHHSPYFSMHIGIGTTIQTFGLNKIIQHVNSTTAFIDFPNSNIRYSYLQQIFIAAPVGVSYRPCKNLELELDGIVGYLLFKEHSFYTAEKHGYIIQTTEHIDNMNPFQYGLRGKINFFHYRTGRPFGCMYSISGNYYISELFKSANNTPTKNFSILAGIGFFIHR
jgi:hypothetical protein